MCAEKEPQNCHRTFLVGKALKDRGVNVAHILANGDIELYDEAMARLLDITRVPREDLFRTADELLKEAMARREQPVAYIDEKLAEDTIGDVE